MAANGTKDDRIDVIVDNRRARFDYDLGDRYEAGLVLKGTEVKSLRARKASLAQAWVKLDERGEAWLMQAHIPEYEHGSIFNHRPTRERKLLLHRHELDRLAREVDQKGATLVPLRLYFRRGTAKLEVAVAQGRKKHDKRRVLKERDARREMERALKSR